MKTNLQTKHVKSPSRYHTERERESVLEKTFGPPIRDPTKSHSELASSIYDIYFTVAI